MVLTRLIQLLWANVAGALIPGATGLGLAARAGKAGKRSCCLVAGTQVLTEDGYKNIEDVKLGEKLWAKDVETGEQDWKPVVKIFNEPDRGIYEIKLQGKDGFIQKIEATDDHPFCVVDSGWKTTIELNDGDYIETDGNGPMKVISVVDEKRQALTYNFTVADFHTYYVTKCNLDMKSGGMGESTKGKFDDVKDTINSIANSGDKEAMECARCNLKTSLKTSLKTRRADRKRTRNKNDKSGVEHQKRIKMEDEGLQRNERKLKEID
ncbi:HINT domain-containing protein [Aestuariibacter sp. AA17]|uniref:HINT domain-containing protein n=1 Tax=Fluctibacter corallii TaxID=2984329 RepID=A0ABT3ADT8_9ALTE|nr:HINT domain-containing protein [Aestuariibacter sp. AA17]MCV2886477.1 HINT domain-containing protein [Aestuariibacter sp. AA17]